MREVVTWKGPATTMTIGVRRRWEWARSRIGRDRGRGLNVLVQDDNNVDDDDDEGDDGQ